MEVSNQLMILPDHVLQNQICQICNQYLSVGPVGISHEKKRLCGICSINKNITPSLYNKVAKYCIFKCNFHYEGCRKLLYFDEFTFHEKICLHKDESLRCAICREFLKNCNHLVNHYQSAHQQCITFSQNDIILDFSSNKGLHLYVIDNFILRVNWRIDASELTISLKSEAIHLDFIGITHYQISVFGERYKQLQFSSTIVSSSNGINVDLNTLKFLGCKNSIRCKFQFFVKINDQYIPFKEQLGNDNIKNNQGLTSTFSVYFFCSACNIVMDGFWYICPNYHKYCQHCCTCKCLQCDSPVKKNAVEGRFSFKVFNSFNQELSLLTNIKQALLKCPWKNCPLTISPEDTEHILNCRFRYIYCPSSECEQKMSWHEVKNHWHLNIPLICSNSLKIKVEDELSFFWFPNYFKNMFKVAVNYFSKQEEVCIDIFYVDVISVVNREFKLYHKNKIYHSEGTIGLRKIYALKSVKLFDLIEIQIV